MRLRYIDYVKGFAIILMLFGHTMTSVNPLHRWIYSFHMPVFFIIGGILIFVKENRNVTSETIGNRVGRRLLTAGVPYYVFGFLLAVFYTLLNIVAGEPISFGSRMFALLSFQGIDSLWFLPVYIFADIIMITVGKTAGERTRFIIAVISIVSVSFFSNYMTSEYLQTIYKVLLGICFFEIGILVAKFRIADKISVWESGILLVIGFYLAQINGDVEMAASKIGNPAIYFLCATVTSVAVLRLFKVVEVSPHCNKILNVIEVYGQNSIVLLCTNNLLVEMIRLIDYKITGNLLITLGMVGCILFTVILMVIEWWIIKLANGKLSLLFGHINIAGKGKEE